MKKITAIIIAVLMIASVFAVATVAFPDNVMPEGFRWAGVDWYAYAGGWVSQAGACENIVLSEPPTYELFPDPSADVVGFYGWAAFIEEDKFIQSFGFKLDGGEMQNSPLSREQELPDRRAEIASVGVPNGEGFWIVFDYSALKAGKHNVALYAIGTDGTTREMFNYDFNLVERYPNQWLCDSTASDTIAPGYWNYPFDTSKEFTATFDAVSVFDGFCIMFYANAEGANVEISLLDASGKVLEKIDHTQLGDGAPTYHFSKSYQPGTYTIRIASVSNAAGADGWFVVGTVAPGDIPVTFGGTFTTNENTREGLFGFLTGPIKENAEDPGEQGGHTNPPSGDAAIVAIATVGCIALAGVVIAKKVR